MNTRHVGKFAQLALVVLVLCGPYLAAQSPPPQGPANGNNAPGSAKPAKKKENTKLHVMVFNDHPQPIANAQVDVNSREEGVSFSTTVFTNTNGEVEIAVPRGKMLIQVMAAHLPSGGALCDLKEENEIVEITLSDPAAVKPCNLKEEKKELVEKKSADPKAED